ncbi:MAG: polyphosphate kinase 2 family protein [Acidobacteria bacterium]|nr:polyphosphate kinase 2 family protein [Acidobacteriota bacterium]
MGNRTMAELFRVKPNSKFRLKGHDPAWERIQEARGLRKEDARDKAQSFLKRSLEELADAQEVLWASDTYSILMVLQAMDAAGKDGIIEHVMSGMNPQGCQVYSFKRPSDEELDHTFLWRCMKALPERGRIGIFNRSYYEEVLVVRVHPEFLDRQKLPQGKRGKSFWKDRFEDINTFEKHLARSGTVIVKFFLNISKEEQRERFLARLEDPRKQWKFSMADLEERNYWNDYMEAFEDAIRETSTEWAPWYVIPADHKWVARAAVASILTETIRSLNLNFPEVDAQQRKELVQAKKQLEKEKLQG